VVVKAREEAMKIFLVVMFLTTVVATVWLAVQNRDHEKVLNLYSAALIGAVGALVTLLFSLEAKAEKTEFPCSPIYHKKTKQPFLPSIDSFVRIYTMRPFEFAVLEDALKAYPEAAKSEDPREGDRLYLDITFRNLVDTLAMTFGHTWEPKITRFDLPTGRQTRTEAEGPLGPVVRKSRSDIAALLPSVRTLSAGPPMLDDLTLPPNSRLAAEASEESRSLRITNPFVDVSLTVSWRGGIIGVGAFKQMCGLTDEQSSEFWSPTYVISCEARFSRFRSGHPNMHRHQKWVEIMFRELRAHLDSERLWKEARAAYQLERGVRPAPSRKDGT
jgi:hypothetical protein